MMKKVKEKKKMIIDIEKENKEKKIEEEEIKNERFRKLLDKKECEFLKKK